MKSIKLGLCAFATCNGLGYQTKAYFEHLKPYRTLVTDISAFNGMEQHPEWYKTNDPEQFEVVFDYGFPSNQTIDKFLQGLDIVLCAENPLNYWMFARAKELGIKTVLVPNFEFLEFLKTPALPRPDLFLVPSIWRIEEIRQFGPTRYLHFPVDRAKIPFTPVKEFLFFLHTLGRKTYMDRNGTLSILDALKKTDDQKVITLFLGPDEIELNKLPYYFGKVDSRVSFMESSNVVDYAELYKGASVFVFPRRYGGNCLPMNEALSKGLPVIMTDIEPQSALLPKEWLVPATKATSFKARTDIDVYEPDAEALAKKMEWFANMSPAEILAESEKANALADTISWESLLPEYIKVFEDLCSQS